MASLLSGTPQTAFSTTTSNTQTPEWMQRAIYDQIQLAQNVAATPYQQYSLPTVAQLSPLQQQAYQQVQSSQGAWVPNMSTALTGTAGVAGNMDTQGGLAQANPYLARAAGLDGAAAAQPMLAQQAQQLGGLNYNAASNTLNQQGSFCRLKRYREIFLVHRMHSPMQRKAMC